jgi:hypothetical protein
MHTRAINSAAGVLLAAMKQGRQTPAGLAIALDAACLLNSPEHAAEDLALRDRVAEYERPADEDPIAYALTPAADQLAAVEQPLTVYRASHDSIVMGLYRTAAEARKHCEAEERRSWGESSAPTNFDWLEDEEDGVAEMTAFVGGEECTTGYVVTALEVASEYDEGADQ